ncbi:GTPase-activating protein [Lithospermum erythrorhizon]|uniref:GTPase-activating protein n=1 Tax=Lithospermum erythrorhizon TaxID=34254 RepID=A0AAV3R3F9_LITER
MRALRRSLTSSSSNHNCFSPSSSSSSSSWNHLRSVLVVVASSSPAYACYSDRGRLKSPWSRRKRKRILSPEQWRSLFNPDGRFRDGGIMVLKRVRSGGVHPSIRAEVWPFLLGVYDLSSSKEDRDATRMENRKEYEKLRRQCRRLLKQISGSFTVNGRDGGNGNRDTSLTGGTDSPDSEDIVSARESLSSEEKSQYLEYSDYYTEETSHEKSETNQVIDSNVVSESESSDSDSSEDPEVSNTFPSGETGELSDPDVLSKEERASKEEVQSGLQDTEDFVTWQKIIRLDAIRANGEWIPYSPSQAKVSNERACRAAEAVGLKDYDHLEPCRIYHASRLVAILEAYALLDPEIGYCQGMSDLLSPIIAVMSEDHEAFWCFVGFMRKARHNFRLDEVGIRRQLSIVSKIIKTKDSHLYRHLEKLQAEDCFFVYRMVVVLFRRELSFEQTLCLWEVMWADQAAIRAGIRKSAWNKIRRAPPTDDLLLYAIAASVFQRRKQIIEKYNSMDEILRACNSMAGHLDVWRLLDDAHDLVVTLHDKVETSL